MGQWCLCLGDCMCRSVGRLWIELGDVSEMYGCVRWVQRLVGSFCFASTVACVSRISFVFFADWFVEYPVVLWPAVVDRVGLW